MIPAMRHARALGALVIFATLAVSLGSRAVTHAHGHCVADGAAAGAVAQVSGASPRGARHADDTRETPGSDGARHAHDAQDAQGAHAVHGAHGAHDAHDAHGATPRALAHQAPAPAAASHAGAALGPMDDCAHCTSGSCEMTTGCGATGAPFALLAVAAPRGPADAAATGPHRRPAVWRSAALAPPTPPPNRLG